MALYSLSTKTISRKLGRSAVAAAAYRSGARLVDERTGVEHDYTRRRGVEHVEIMALDGIVIADSAALWNAAEAAEKRQDGRTAREVLVALPAELDAGQRTELARAIARDLVERYGVAAELAIHAPDRDGDQRNHHAHILITTRRWNHDGPGAKSQLEMSDTQLKKAGLPKSADELTAMRERWAWMQNTALERAGLEARVDHRSLEAQGIDRVPQVHQGNYATQMIRQGTPERSERASLNLEIIAINSEVQALREQLAIEQAAERAVQEAHEREDREAWEAWISRPDVSSDGRLITELWVDEMSRRSWQLHLAAEKAEREAAEKARRDAQEREAAEKARRDAQEREAAEKARQAAQGRALAPLRRAEAAATDAGAEVLELTFKVRRLDEERGPARQRADQLRRELADAQQMRDSITGWFKGREKREAQARVDELTGQYRAAQSQASSLDGECRDAARKLDAARKRSRTAAADLEREKARFERPSPAFNPSCKPSQRQGTSETWEQREQRQRAASEWEPHRGSDGPELG